MKKLNIILLITVLSLISYEAFSQTFGVKGGMNLATIDMRDDYGEYNDDAKYNAGFHIGMIVDAEIKDYLSVESGIMFNKKGVRYKFDYDDFTEKFLVNLYYVDIPITLKGKYGISDNVNVFASAGPSIGFGLFGKYIDKYDGEKDTEEVTWGSDPEDLKRMDFAMVFGGGVEVNSVILGVYYDLGLTSIDPIDDEGWKARNRIVKFSVGYKFNKK